MAKNPFHCSSEAGASVDTKYASFTFLSSACVWPNVTNSYVFSAGLAHMLVAVKRMPQKDLINIRNYDVRHLIPKVCSAVLKNGAEILTESIMK